MSKKRHKPEEIVSKLRQVAVLTAQGTPVADAVRSIGATEVMRDELLDGELFYSLREAQIIIESWRIHYNTRRPHASLGYRPPAPEVFVPAMAACPTRPAAMVQRPTLN
jgi:transposase InsO family protein